MKAPECMSNSPPASAEHGRTAAEAAALAPWFHNLHLPDGTQTAPNHPLGDFPRFKWEQIRAHLPEDLSGCTALDIGCNAGFYSIELARRGASVTALDLDAHFLQQAGWAAAQFGVQHRVRILQGHVYGLASWPESFDVVLFLGVFYHLRHPLLALDLAAHLTRRWLVFQTLSLPGEELVDTPDDLPLEERGAMARAGWPAMAFIEKSFAGDATNWWAPNKAAIEAMLRSAGLEVMARPGHEIYLCRPAPGAGESVGRVREEMGAASGAGGNGIRAFSSQPPRAQKAGL